MFEYEFRLFNGELLTVMRVPSEMSELDLADCLLELSQEHQAPVIWSLV